MGSWGIQRRLNVRHRGLTLVEVLVVIAIIAVLAGVLLPALGAMRAAAREGACLAMIRQASLAVFEYASVHKDEPPVPMLAREATLEWGVPRAEISHDPGWMQLEYFGGRGAFHWVLLAEGWLDQAYWCPSSDGARDLSSILVGSPLGASWPGYGPDGRTPASTYAISDAFKAVPEFFGPRGLPRMEMLGRQRLTSVAFPSSKCLMYEHACFHRTGSPERVRADWPHATTVVWSDGSASAKRPTDAIPGATRPFLREMPRPLEDTADGILGRDR